MRRRLLFVLLLAVLGASWASGETVATPASQADVVLLLLYVLLALLVSFLCSVAEAVILSISPPFIEGLRGDKPRVASLLWKLKVENLDRSLAAILTLNTIAHTVGAIGAGAKATAVFGSGLFGVFSALMTLMILFLSEIIPKTLGALFWRNLAAATGFFVQTLIGLLYPLILVSEVVTRWMARGQEVHVFSRDEFVAMAAMGEESGGLEEHEFRIIRNLLMLDELTAEEIMTPRPVIEALQQDLVVGDAVAQTADVPFSRFPVYRESLDDISGWVLKNDILLQHANGESSMPIGELRRDLPTVPESLPLRQLMEFLLEHRRSHIALVVDEYGGTQGLVTLEDTVETLLGLEIVDEVDQNVDMQVVARRRWKRRARELGILSGQDEK